MDVLPARDPAFPDDGRNVPKILFFDHTAALGGGEVALLNLVKRLDRSRFRPIVALGATGTLQARLLEAGVETHVLPMDASVVHTRKDSLGVGSLLRVGAMAHSVAYAWRLARFMRRHQIALVHTNSLKADIIGGVAARLARVPVIWHVRDRIENDYLPAPVVTLFRKLCRIVPAYVIANSTATLHTLRLPQDRLTATVYSGVDQKRIQVVHDGVDGDKARHKPNASSSCVIGIVGRLSPWKGQHIFLQMAAAVHARFPNARFQICGSAMFGEEAYEAELRAQAQRLRLQDCVEFLGFRADVFAVVEGLDLLVHASTTGEPFGQVIIEGMALGKPVVATNGGGVPEIVVEAVTGHLVPMNDADAMTNAVLDLLQDTARAQAMGQAGYERVQECFTIELTVKRVEAIYDEILSWRKIVAFPAPDRSSQAQKES